MKYVANNKSGAWEPDSVAAQYFQEVKSFCRTKLLDIGGMFSWGQTGEVCDLVSWHGAWKNALS